MNKKRDRNRMLLVMCSLAAFGAFMMLCAGCSQFQAQGVAASSIDSQNAAGEAFLTGPSPTPAASRAYVASNAPLVHGWVQTATVNWFAYANPFAAVGTAPQIYVSPTYYGLLQATDAEFGQAAALLPAATDSDAVTIAKKQALRFVKIEAAKGGVVSPTNPTSQPAQ